jgi:hypothetical protein
MPVTPLVQTLLRDAEASLHRAREGIHLGINSDAVATDFIDAGERFILAGCEMKRIAIEAAEMKRTEGSP